MFKTIKYFFIMLIIVLLAGVGATYLYLDSIIKHAIETKGSEIMGVPVTVGTVSMGLPDGKFAVKNLKIANPAGFQDASLFEAENIEVVMHVRSIFADVVQINNITIESPSFSFEHNGTSDNIKTLMHNIEASSKKDDKVEATGSTEPHHAEHKTKKVMVENFDINNAKVSAALGNLARKSIELPDIHIENVGSDEKGITIADATDQIFREVTKFIYKIDLKTLLNSTIENVKEGATSIKDAVKAVDVEAVKEGLGKLLGN